MPSLCSSELSIELTDRFQIESEKCIECMMRKYLEYLSLFIECSFMEALNMFWSYKGQR